MRILFDLGHAAHFHLFKHAIIELKRNGHLVTVVSRDKPYLINLLDTAEIEHICLSKPGEKFLSLVAEWLKRTYRILKLHRKNNFDIAIGTSVSISYLSLFSNVTSINVQEDDDKVIPLHVLLAYPFSTYILNPKFLKYKFFKRKRLLHNSLHEMAYLCEGRFSPDQTIVQKYSLEPFRYIVIRKVSFKAHHDINQSGLSEKHIDLVKESANNFSIVTSEEGGINIKDANDMHQILSFAKLVVTDSQTMAAEAACLGTPIIQVSSFKKNISYINELCKLGLIDYYLPGEINEFKNALTRELKIEPSVKYREMTRHKINATFPDFTKILIETTSEVLKEPKV